MTINIAIIGSGPTGYATYHGLKDNKNLNIKIFSSGENIVNSIDNFFSYKNLNTDQKYQYFKNQLIQKTRKGLIPKKKFFLSSSTYSKKNIFEIKKNNKISLDVSNNIGGLSNVWGANVSYLSNLDIKNFPKYNKLKKPFEEITKLISIAGERDNNDTCNIHYGKKLQYGSVSDDIIEKYKNNKSKNKAFRVGYSKLAIETKGDKGCENCGLCLYGCHKDSIFSSRFFFNNIRQLQENSEIIDITENEKNVTLKIRNSKTKEENEESFDIIFLCAGVINTSALVLKFLKKKNNIKSLRIKDSTKYHFFSLSLKREKKNFLEAISLSNIFMQCDIDSFTFHSQFYRSKLFFDLIFSKFKFFKNNFVEKTLDILSRFILIGNVYLPSELSNDIKFKLEKDEIFLEPIVKKNILRKYYIIRFYIKTFIENLKLGNLIIPFFLSSKIGESQHFGSSLPMKETPNIGETHETGLIMGSKKIYICDTSNLGRIPSTPTTFLAMANALNIAKNFSKKN